MALAAALMTASMACAATAKSTAKQSASAARNNEPVVAMVSDIHFDPFEDPAKVARLDAAAVGEWKSILAEPMATDHESRFAALNSSCHFKGADTDFALLESTMKALRLHAGGAAFATLSGDLLAHDFRCRYEKALPGGKNYASFTAKTIEFVMAEMRAALPGKPLYAALGNNDSDCEDYQLDLGSSFFRELTESFLRDVPAADRTEAEKSFAETGSYAVHLPGEMATTRLIVLDDLFMSKKHSACSAKKDPRGAEAVRLYLAGQLAAGEGKETKWVMAHIPPGIDPYSTILKMRDICGGEKPDYFLSSDSLRSELTKQPVALAIFAHTHMDEMRLLHSDDGSQKIAAKLVPSVSPIHGNHPAFVLARVNAQTATVSDYRVVASAAMNDPKAEWKTLYDFDQLFAQKRFDATAVEALLTNFRKEPEGKASEAYLHQVQSGEKATPLALFWPEYACTLGTTTEAGLRQCMCPAK
jgi:sphingomyelin phosphodiesterase acid-like 3